VTKLKVFFYPRQSLIVNRQTGSRKTMRMEAMCEFLWVDDPGRYELAHRFIGTAADDGSGIKKQK
jgi:hypothetical protein